MDVSQMWQQYLGALGKTAAGGAGAFDPFTPALDKVLAQAYTATAAEPILAQDQPDSDAPDSDAPAPAGQDEQA